jgi:hypothetical protein
MPAAGGPLVEVLVSVSMRTWTAQLGPFTGPWDTQWCWAVGGGRSNEQTGVEAMDKRGIRGNISLS